MKKRKKYNPCKSIIEKSQSIINSTAVALILGDKTEYVDLIPNDFKSFELTHVYLKPRHLWTVALTILRVNEKGEQCLTVHHVQPQSKCKADEIGDSVNKTLKMMIDKCDDKEFLVQFCKDHLKAEHMDYFIFGHRHLPLTIKVGEQSTYINLGEWIKAFQLNYLL